MREFQGRIGISKEERTLAHRFAKKNRLHSWHLKIKRGQKNNPKILYFYGYDEDDVLYKVMYKHVKRQDLIDGHQVAKSHKLEYFLKQAKEVHGDKYDYNLVENDDIGWQLKLPLVCNKKGHGLFMQTKQNHITDKRGCPVCGRRKVNAIR